jgi:plasmid stabilization system protein ParE
MPRSKARPRDEEDGVTFHVRFTEDAVEDIDRLYEFLLTAASLGTAERALDALRNGIALLEASPFSCRKATARSPFLREIVIPFGNSGYVALFEIEDHRTVTILGVRHQREDDFY